MRLVKDIEPKILHQDFDMNCSMILQIRKAQYDELVSKLEKVESLRFADKK